MQLAPSALCRPAAALNRSAGSSRRCPARTKLRAASSGAGGGGSGAPATDGQRELQSLRERIAAHQAQLQAHVQREEFEQAAAERDVLLRLELRERQLQLDAERQRQAHVLHSIGTVIQHRRFGYRGVIAGAVVGLQIAVGMQRGAVCWPRPSRSLRPPASPPPAPAAAGHDPRCMADEGWIQQMRVDMLPGGREQPFYSVLVDVRDRPGGQTTYVAQVWSTLPQG